MLVASAPRRSGVRAVVGLAALSLVTTAQSPALRQVSPVPERIDEGSFTVLMGGQRVGREQFSVHLIRSGDATYELRSESAYGERRAAMRLEADSAGTPLRYSLEERQGTEQVLRLGGQRIRDRFTTLARSTTGEAAREYLLTPGTVIVEEDGWVQYALLVRLPLEKSGDAVTLPSLSPSANSRGPVHIVLETVSDTLAMTGMRRHARRWRVVTASSEVRMVWADSLGRILRVMIPSRALDARRDDVPA